MTPDIEDLADAILRASGSALSYIDTPKTRYAVLAATEAAAQAGQKQVVAWLLEFARDNLVAAGRKNPSMGKERLQLAADIMDLVDKIEGGMA